MLNIVTKGAVDDDILIEDDLIDIESRIVIAKETLLTILFNLENKRDLSKKLDWSELIDIPISDAYTDKVGISRIDTFLDSVSETTAGSIWAVKSLLRKIDDLADDFVKVNGKALIQDITLAPANFNIYTKAQFDNKIGSYSISDPTLVLKTTTINGKPLSGDINFIASDFGFLTKEELNKRYNTYLVDGEVISKTWLVNGKAISTYPKSDGTYLFWFTAASLGLYDAAELRNTTLSQTSLTPTGTGSSPNEPTSDTSRLIKWSDTINGVRFDRDGKSNLTIKPSDFQEDYVLISETESFIRGIYDDIIGMNLRGGSTSIITPSSTNPIAEFTGNSILRMIVPRQGGLYEALISPLVYTLFDGTTVTVPYYDGV